MDRAQLRYLAREAGKWIHLYRVPLGVTLVAVGVLVAGDIAELPSPPPWMIPYAASASLLAIPSYALMDWLVKKLHPGPETVTVGVADPGPQEQEEIGLYTIHNVAPRLWEERDVVGYPPLPDPEGPCDYLVTSYQYYAEIEQVEVRGAEWSDMTPAEAWEHAEQVQEYYDNHHTVRRKYSRLKATVSRFLTEVHDATLLGELEEQEEAELLPDVSVLELVEEMEDRVDGLPEGPSESMSTQEQRKRGIGELDEDLIPDEPITPAVDGERTPAATDGGRDE